MKITLLVGSDEFWSSLDKDIQSAGKYVFVQTLSFEGDSVGKKLSNSMVSSKASDKRLLVDSYIKMIISDKFLYTPKNLFDSELQDEVKETKQLIEDIKTAGIKVKFTNPIGFLLSKILLRNHKKLMVIDDKITYIGGINFSDHNFYWHDMMIRIEDDEVAKFMKQDFLMTWDGENQGISKAFKDIEFYIFDGYSNESLFGSILKLIGNAKKSVYVISPYLTFPFCNQLKEVNRKGVAVTIITPDLNNKQFMKNNLLWETAESNIEMRLYQGKMMHLKALLIDDEFLVVGSSNFDFLSYRAHQENAAVITAPEFISDFKERVLAVDLKNSIKVEESVSKTKGYLSNLGLKSIDKLLAIF